MPCAAVATGRRHRAFRTRSLAPGPKLHDAAPRADVGVTRYSADACGSCIERPPFTEGDSPIHEIQQEANKKERAVVVGAVWRGKGNPLLLVPGWSQNRTEISQQSH